MRKWMKIALAWIVVAGFFHGFVHYNISSIENNFLTRYVDDDFNETTPGWELTCYNTIQQAIDNAKEYDIIFVNNGTYDGAILINKSLQLLGENRNHTIIDPNYAEIGVTITADDVILSGFCINNTHPVVDSGCVRVKTREGIYVSANHTTITGNTIGDKCVYGIYVLNGSNTTISDNIILDNKYGIKIEKGDGRHTISDNIIKNKNYSYGVRISNSPNSTISDNTIITRTEGISLYKSPHSVILRNTVFNNTGPQSSYDNRYGISVSSDFCSIAENTIVNNDYGISIDGKNNAVFKNTITDNKQSGMQINAQQSSVYQNTIQHNRRGVEFNDAQNISFYLNSVSFNTYGVSFLYECSHNTVFKNIISNNLNIGVHIWSFLEVSTWMNFSMEDASNNKFYYNDFINNKKHAVDDSTNIWDNGYPNGGNYWDDYIGEDNNNDGIGDVPYIISNTIQIWNNNYSYNISGGNNQDRYPKMIPYFLLNDAQGPYNAKVGEKISFTGSVLSGTPPYIWRWGFGDGTTSSEQNPKHTYDKRGNYSVVLTVTDSNGNITDDSTYAAISCPVAWVDDDYNQQTMGWAIDHFSRIQEGIDHVDINGTVYVSSGIYYESILINKSINLIGEKNTTTIINYTNSVYIVKIAADAVTIDGFTIQTGDYQSIYEYMSFAGITFMQDSHSVVISNNIIKNNIAWGITNYYQSYNNTISGNIIEVFYCGIEKYHSSNSIISGNYIKNILGESYGGIILDYSYNETVTDNHLVSTYISISGNQMDHWNTHRIEHNTVNDKPVYYYANMNNVVIPQNFSQIILANCTNSIIQNRRFNDTPNTIKLGYSSNISIMNNTFTNKTGTNIYLYKSNQNSITNNTFNITCYTDYPSSQGILLQDSLNNSVSLNTFIDQPVGIKLSNSSYNNFSENTLFNNIYAIEINEPSSYNSISKNTITYTKYGIHLTKETKSNYIFHNNFLHNTHHAFDRGTNIWDNGYSSGGNYWDDYFAADEQRDGIRDIPYDILGSNSADRYPLMVSYTKGSKHNISNTEQVVLSFAITTVKPVISWTKTLGNYGSIGYYGHQTTDDGFIITGFSNEGNSTNSNIDVLLIKTDENGSEQWYKALGGNRTDYGHCVQQTHDNGYIILGFTHSYGAGNRDILLIKTDHNGNEEWNTTFGGNKSDEGNFVQQTNDGGYIITGETDSFGQTVDAIWLIKTDEHGNEEWNTTFSKQVRSEGSCVQQTSEGGYIIAGSTTYSGDIWLIRTNSFGNEEWNKTFGGKGSDSGQYIQQTKDGGFIIAGSTGSYDVWLIKIDENGTRQWDKTYGGLQKDEGYSVEQTTDGGYIIGGATSSYGTSYTNAWIIKTDSSGNEEWNTTISENYYSKGNSVHQTSDGGYVLIGRAGYCPVGGNKVLLIKLHTETINDLKGVSSFPLFFIIGTIVVIIGEIGFALLWKQRKK